MKVVAAIIVRQESLGIFWITHGHCRSQSQHRSAQPLESIDLPLACRTRSGDWDGSRLNPRKE